jgi:hypothetical protein
MPVLQRAVLSAQCERNPVGTRMIRTLRMLWFGGCGNTVEDAGTGVAGGLSAAVCWIWSSREEVPKADNLSTRSCGPLILYWSMAAFTSSAREALSSPSSRVACIPKRSCIVSKAVVAWCSAFIMLFMANFSNTFNSAAVWFSTSFPLYD